MEVNSLLGVPASSHRHLAGALGAPCLQVSQWEYWSLATVIGWKVIQGLSSTLVGWVAKGQGYPFACFFSGQCHLQSLTWEQRAAACPTPRCLDVFVLGSNLECPAYHGQMLIWMFAMVLELPLISHVSLGNSPPLCNSVFSWAKWGGQIPASLTSIPAKIVYLLCGLEKCNLLPHEYSGSHKTWAHTVHECTSSKYR